MIGIAHLSAAGATLRWPWELYESMDRTLDAMMRRDPGVRVGWGQGDLAGWTLDSLNMSSRCQKVRGRGRECQHAIYFQAVL